MKSILSAILLGALAACSGSPDCCDSCGSAAPARQTVEKSFLKSAESRTFSIDYVGKVPELPAGTKKLRVWLPVPQDSTVQAIKNLSFTKEARLGSEPKYGNQIAYFEIENPGASAEITMRFDCTRLEIRTEMNALQSEGKDDPESFGVFRKADKLVLVDDETKKISDKVTEARKGTLEKARAIYEYVVSKMVYDKNHPGWGLGSTRHACDVGKGNCTDFHALFTSLCRSQGIASGFEIGLYLPYDRKSDEKPGGYHCWALFRVPGKTWVPVDCSEAMRFPARRDFFFGGHTSNRVTISTGRDLTLEPKQDGEPLNYFLNPYAEADGKPVKTDKSWSFKDLD
ncbi:MAG: transglutaminase domain-containing protein [Planctomycetes bacterium]|nr:transglutaminase domain-containing protein [Planctomycetota bacterium]